MNTSTTTLAALGSTAELGSHARREIGHWLNELPNRDVDRRALAELCADYDALENEVALWREVGAALLQYRAARMAASVSVSAAGQHR